ncbi:MAG: hypothetical protein AAB460_01415 [Patescibacteria group bacterium]
MNTSNQKGFANIVLIVVVVILLGLCTVGYFVFVKKSGSVAQQPTPTPVASKYTYYTFAEAGIPDLFDSDSSNLAYIEAIVKRDDKLFVTIDPVRIINCRKLQDEHETLPAICPADPAHAVITDAFPIEADKMTQTLEMLPSAGPFFYYSPNYENQWRTTDINTSQAFLDSKIGPTNYSFSQITLFHVTQKDGKVTKIIERRGP